MATGSDPRCSRDGMTDGYARHVYDQMYRGTQRRELRLTYRECGPSGPISYGRRDG